jgi:hypothetical protein
VFLLIFSGNKGPLKNNLTFWKPIHPVRLCGENEGVSRYASSFHALPNRRLNSQNCELIFERTLSISGPKSPLEGVARQKKQGVGGKEKGRQAYRILHAERRMKKEKWKPEMANLKKTRHDSIFRRKRLAHRPIPVPCQTRVES